MTNIEKLKYVADYYGVSAQLVKTNEELQELNDVIFNINRNDAFDELRSNLIEEIADVENMLFQVKYLLKLDQAEIHQIATAKMNRQIGRIEQEKSEAENEKH